MTLEELTESVLAISPELMDAREAAAIVESCGVNDRIALADFGMPNTFAVGDYILRHSRPTLAVMQQKEPSQKASTILSEARLAAQKFSLSFAYAVPWTALIIIEYLRPKLLQLSPEWGGILSLSLIASLISAGGFSQAITRTGYFYIGVREPKLALRLCLIFVKWGCFASCILGAAGFLLANYFKFFTPVYLLLGCLNYLILVMLWMFCAMLSVQGRAWRIPLVFAFGGAVFAVLHGNLHLSGVLPLFAADVMALGAAAGLSLWGFRDLPSTSPPGTPTPGLPRLPVLVFMLAPSFLYGLCYFAFLFADRIAAGSAIPWASGLSFGVDSQYKQGMDVALFIFLVLAAVVEYMADSFMRHWFALAEQNQEESSPSLKRRYGRSLMYVCLLFLVLASGLWFTYSRFQPAVLVTAVLGSVGYFFVALALFHIIILFSLNHAGQALGLISIALVCNGVTGYVLSHLFGVEFAAIGLLVGGLVLFAMSYKVIAVVLREADYFYALA